MLQRETFVANKWHSTDESSSLTLIDQAVKTAGQTIVLRPLYDQLVLQDINVPRDV